MWSRGISAPGRFGPGFPRGSGFFRTRISTWVWGLEPTQGGLTKPSRKYTEEQQGNAYISLVALQSTLAPSPHNAFHNRAQDIWRRDGVNHRSGGKNPVRGSSPPVASCEQVERERNQARGQNERRKKPCSMHTQCRHTIRFLVS